MADLDEFSFEVTSPRRPLIEDVVANLREFAKSHSPIHRRRQDYESWKGRKFHPHTLLKHFGSWQELMATAGIEYDKFSSVRTSKLEVSENIKSFVIAHSINERTAGRFEKWSGRDVSMGALKQHFPSWHAAMSELGFECPTRTRSTKHSDEDYLAATEQVWRWSMQTLHRSPTAKDFKTYIASHVGGVSPATLVRRFGALTRYLESFAQWKAGKITRNALLNLSGATKIVRIPFSKKLRYEVLHEAGFRCATCGRCSDDGAVLHVDHIIPVSLGGTNERSNLRALCDDCNLGRSNKYLV